MTKFRSRIHLAAGSKFKWLACLVLLGVFVVSPSLVFAKKVEPTLRPQIEDTFTRYAHYLDTQWHGGAWRYSVPSRQYKEIDLDSAQNIRMQATFASAYLFTSSKDADEKIRTAMLDIWYYHPEARVSSVLRKGERISTRSFHDAIGIFLSLQILFTRAWVFSTEEYTTMLSNIRLMVPWVLSAPDTENRALLGAAYGSAILSHPIIGLTSEQHRVYSELIQKKIEKGLQSIDKKFVYREGKNRHFSVHYHLVSAAMLHVLAVRRSDAYLKKIADGMTKYIRTRYPLGSLSWRGSHRPTGIGLQTVLLRAFCEKMSGNKQWVQYWEREKKGRGFIDGAVTGRLVWRDEVDKTINDDYSFVNMGMLLYKHF